MIQVRNPSLEFNWLPNSVRKGLRTPRLVVLDEDRWGGFYVRQTNERCVYPDLDMDLAEGPVIALCASQDAGCLAHEYRHHWQVESGHELGESIWAEQPNESYKESIVRYFKSYWWEMDALRFQLKHGPDDWSLQWREWLLESK